MRFNLRILLAKNNNASRYVQLDFLRGVAIIAMIIFHFTFDLSYFGFIASDTMYRPNWVLFQKFIAGTFIFVSGISLHLCHGSGIRWAFIKKRLLLVGGAALVISVTTIFAFGDFWIKFGILHCILTCSIMCLVFVDRSFGVILSITIFLGIAVFFVRTPIDLPVGFQWLIETRVQHYSVDYSPVVPWIFVFSCGIFFSKFNSILNFSAPSFVEQMRDISLVRSLAYIGQRSLAIYLIHQPLMFLSFHAYLYLT